MVVGSNALGRAVWRYYLVRFGIDVGLNIAQLKISGLLGQLAGRRLHPLQGGPWSLW